MVDCPFLQEKRHENVATQTWFKQRGFLLYLDSNYNEIMLYQGDCF